MAAIEFVSKDEFFSKHTNTIDMEEIENRLNSAAASKNAEEYETSAMERLTPFLELEKKYPAEFTAAISRLYEGRDDSEHTIVNHVVSYDIKGERLQLHLHSSVDMSKSRVLAEFEDGLRKLAPIVEENQKIQKITALSWIVAVPGGAELLRRKFGFTVEKTVPKSVGEEDWGDNRISGYAWISREDFLKRYGQKL